MKKINKFCTIHWCFAEENVCINCPFRSEAKNYKGGSRHHMKLVIFGQKLQINSYNYKADNFE